MFESLRDEVQYHLTEVQLNFRRELAAHVPHSNEDVIDDPRMLALKKGKHEADHVSELTFVFFMAILNQYGQGCQTGMLIPDFIGGKPLLDV